MTWQGTHLITFTCPDESGFSNEIWYSKAFNPEYRFTETVMHFSLGEMAAPFIAFGDLEAATVNRTLVEYFFRELFSETTRQAVP